jgi:2-dehydro-3-deoxyphosphogluconate aldolase/(4S)-4-hydroxy-2-oxoglutarate aldolase
MTAQPYVSDFVARLARQRVLPVLRLPDAGAALDAALQVADAGLELVELTATTPDWEQALARAVAQRPGAWIGLGTVTSAGTARRAIEAGARFLVSPWGAADVREHAAAAGVPFLEGAFSPGELAACAARGPLKLFPAHVGGTAYLKSMLAVLPGAQVVPTGGIRLPDVPAWLAAGAVAVGVGSDLLAGDVGERLAATLGPVRA